MGGECSQKLRPWRGIHSSQGLYKRPLQLRINTLAQRPGVCPQSVPAIFLFETSCRVTATRLLT